MPDTNAAADDTPSATPTRTRLPGISPEAYRHPYDRQAAAALRAVPGFELAATKFSRYSVERFLYVLACADAVRVTPRQCGRIHALLREACAVLDIWPEPNLFLTQTPIPNASALGREMPSILIHTGLVEMLSEEEILAVIAHELGHIQCGHTVYLLMLWLIQSVLKRYGSAVPVPGVGDWLSLSLEATLLEWLRKAEFSADRAALLCVQNPEVVFSVLFKLTGGSPKIYEQMDREEYLRQAEDYDNPGAPPLDKVYKMLLSVPQTHPIPVLRAREALRYGDSDEYRTILSGEYRRRDKVTARQEMILCPRCGEETDRAAFSFCTQCGADLPAPGEGE